MVSQICCLMFVDQYKMGDTERWKKETIVTVYVIFSTNSQMSWNEEKDQYKLLQILQIAEVSSVLM